MKTRLAYISQQFQFCLLKQNTFGDLSHLFVSSNFSTGFGIEFWCGLIEPWQGWFARKDEQKSKGEE